MRSQSSRAFWDQGDVPVSTEELLLVRRDSYNVTQQMQDGALLFSLNIAGGETSPPSQLGHSPIRRRPR